MRPGFRRSLAVIEINDPKAAGIGEGYLVMRAVAADAGRSLVE